MFSLEIRQVAVSLSRWRGYLYVVQGGDSSSEDHLYKCPKMVKQRAGEEGEGEGEEEVDNDDAE